MIDLITELLHEAPVALIIGFVGFCIFLPLFGFACAFTDFSAGGGNQKLKIGDKTITIKLKESDELTPQL